MEWVGALGGVPAVMAYIIALAYGGYAQFHQQWSIASSLYFL
jgi:hypothetical protein